MPEAFSNIAIWQIVKKVTGYRLQASGFRSQVVMDRGTRDDRCAGTMDDIKTDGRGKTVPFGHWEDRSFHSLGRRKSARFARWEEGRPLR